MIRTDPIAECLVMAARLYGDSVSVEALTAGLPLEDGRLTPELAARAAERAGLAARFVQMSIAALAREHQPAVLLLSDASACLLLKSEADRAQILLPETPEAPREVALGDLAAGYSGRALLLERLQRFSAGTASERVMDTHHWFWGTLRAEVPTYAEVAVATVLVNVFALAAPLFFMNVYDRVVPNQAMETLWVLAVGMAAVLAFDLVLKMLRGYFIDVVGRRADLALSSALFARVMDLKLDQPRQPAGTLANNLREFESLREFFTSATLVSIIDLPFVLLFLGAIFWIGGMSLVLPVLVAIPIVVAVGLALQPALRDHIRRSFAATEAKYATVIETVAAIEHVKHLNAASQASAQVGKPRRFRRARKPHRAAPLVIRAEFHRLGAGHDGRGRAHRRRLSCGGREAHAGRTDRVHDHRGPRRCAPHAARRPAHALPHRRDRARRAQQDHGSTRRARAGEVVREPAAARRPR